MELDDARSHRATAPVPGTKKKEFKYKAHKGADVRQALEKLFHGKCAYCETYLEKGRFATQTVQIPECATKSKAPGFNGALQGKSL